MFTEKFNKLFFIFIAIIVLIGGFCGCSPSVDTKERALAAKEDDGLDIVNKYLEEGWKVKHISACAMGDSKIIGQAYIVIEKE